MPLEIFNFAQGSSEWLSLRRGLPTASMFHAILAKGEGKTRQSYMYRLLGERITGEIVESYKNDDMTRGNRMESEAREAYALAFDAEPQLVGFIRNGDVGCSPDSLIGDKGLLEIKTKRADLLLKVIFDDVVPSEHVAQVQGQLWVAEREWCDFVSYWPGIRLFVKRVYRDEKYIASLAAGVQRFLDELHELENKYRQAA